jgi:hypothetical protein
MQTHSKAASFEPPVGWVEIFPEIAAGGRITLRDGRYLVVLTKSPQNGAQGRAWVCNCPDGVLRSFSERILCGWFWASFS